MGSIVSFCKDLKPQYLEQIATRFITPKAVGIQEGYGKVRLRNIYAAFQFTNQKRKAVFFAKQTALNILASPRGFEPRYQP